MTVEEDNLEQFNEHLNDYNLFNDNDNVFDGSNVDGDIDDHFIPPLEIYDSRNRDNFDAKTKYFNWKRTYCELDLTFSTNFMSILYIFIFSKSWVIKILLQEKGWVMKGFS